jgi:hypothetical protein
MKKKVYSLLSINFKRNRTFRKADELLACSDKIDGFFKPALLRSKQVQILTESLIVFKVIFCYFISTIYTVEFYLVTRQITCRFWI